MAALNIYKSENQKQEFLRISRAAKAVNGCISIVSYIDKETNQYIAYVPSLELSGYGENKSQAMDLLKFTIDDYFKHILNYSQTAIEVELSKLGWKHSWYKRKEFSKTYIDVSGTLKDFAIEDSVDVEVLTM